MRETTTHPSYGLIQITRRKSNKAKTLFGSSIKHENTICIKINGAEKERHLHSYYYFTKKPYIEFEISQSQFVNMMTSVGIGSGTPITITYLEGKPVEPCPDENVMEKFESEFENDIKSISKKMNELNDLSKKIEKEKGTLKVSEKRNLCRKIQQVNQEITLNLPFVLTLFNKQMNNSTQEMKEQIESFISNTAMDLGIDELKSKLEINLIDLKKDT